MDVDTICPYAQFHDEHRMRFMISLSLWYFLHHHLYFITVYALGAYVSATTGLRSARTDAGLSVNSIEDASEAFNEEVDIHHLDCSSHR